MTSSDGTTANPDKQHMRVGADQCIEGLTRVLLKLMKALMQDQPPVV